MEESRIYGVYSEIPDENVQSLRKTTELLLKNNNTFSLEILPESLKYHVTFFMSPFPVAKLQNIAKIVEEISCDLKQINLIGDKLSTSKNKLFLFLDIKTDNLIMNLHQKVVYSLNELRDGLVYPDFKNADWLPKKNREYLFQFGFPWVLDEYEPHISLLISKKELLVEDFVPYYKLPIGIKVDKICIGEIGSFGTIKREKYSFNISKG